MYLTNGGAEAADKIPAAQLVIRGVNDLFLHQESDIWGEDPVPETEEEKLYQLGEHFPEIEGMQERIYESMNTADAVLEETMKTRKEMIAQFGLEDSFRALQQLVQLSSGSDFVELEWKRKQQRNWFRNLNRHLRDSLVWYAGQLWQTLWKRSRFSSLRLRRWQIISVSR